MSSTVPNNISTRPVAVIGAGTLGRRIALMFAAHGAAVNIYDLAEEQRRAAVDFVKRELHTMADQHTDQVQGRVSAKADLAEALQDTWLVVEAIPERLELKIQMFGQLDELAPADAVLASNSSSYASRMFLDKVHHPERVLNIHFYMPPKQNAVVVMSDGETDRDVPRLRHGDAADLRASPVRSTQGEHGVHLQPNLGGGEARSLEVVAEGVSTPQEIDRMFQINTGSSAGPFRMMDRVGLDVVLDIEEHYRAEHPEYPEGPRRVLRSYLEQGRLGVKSGAGFYDDYSHP